MKRLMAWFKNLWVSTGSNYEWKRTLLARAVERRQRELGY